MSCERRIPFERNPFKWAEPLLSGAVFFVWRKIGLKNFEHLHSANTALLRRQESQRRVTMKKIYDRCEGSRRHYHWWCWGSELVGHRFNPLPSWVSTFCLGRPRRICRRGMRGVSRLRDLWLANCRSFFVPRSQCCHVDALRLCLANALHFLSWILISSISKMQ